MVKDCPIAVNDLPQGVNDLPDAVSDLSKGKLQFFARFQKEDNKFRDCEKARY